MTSYNQSAASQGSGPSPSGAAGSAGKGSPDRPENKPAKKPRTQNFVCRKFLCVHCLADDKIVPLINYNSLRKHQGRIHNCWREPQTKALCDKCDQSFEGAIVPSDHSNMKDCNLPKRKRHWRPQPQPGPALEQQRADMWMTGSTQMHPELVWEKNKMLFPTAQEARRRMAAVSQRYSQLRGQLPQPGRHHAGPPAGNPAPVAQMVHHHYLQPAQNGAGPGVYLPPTTQNQTAGAGAWAAGLGQPPYPQLNMGLAPQQQQPAAPLMGHQFMGIQHGVNNFAQQQHLQSHGTFGQQAQFAAPPTGYVVNGIPSGINGLGQQHQQQQHLQTMQFGTAGASQDTTGQWDADFGMGHFDSDDFAMDDGFNDPDMFEQTMEDLNNVSLGAPMEQPAQGPMDFGGPGMQQGAGLSGPIQQNGWLGPAHTYEQPGTYDQTEMGAYPVPPFHLGHGEAGVANPVGSTPASSAGMVQNAGMDYLGQSDGYGALPHTLEEPALNIFSAPRPSDGAPQPLRQANAGEQALAGSSGAGSAEMQRRRNMSFHGHRHSHRRNARSQETRPTSYPPRSSPSAGTSGMRRTQTFPFAQHPEPQGPGAATLSTISEEQFSLVDGREQPRVWADSYLASSQSPSAVDSAAARSPSSGLTVPSFGPAGDAAQAPVPAATASEQHPTPAEESDAMLDFDFGAFIDPSMVEYDTSGEDFAVAREELARNTWTEEERRMGCRHDELYCDEY